MNRKELLWFEAPRDPAKPWPRRTIGTLPRESQSGLAVGDLAGHGRPDLVCGNYWAECPADPTHEPWTIRRYSDWEAKGWGGMDKLAIADMDGDRRPDIVASQAEIPDSPLGIFRRNPDKLDGLWSYRPIDTGLYCPHSLVVADINDDGRPDVIAGEMTAGGWSFPMNSRPRIIAYLNQGDRPFQRRTLSTGVGVHEMGILPDRYHGKWLIYAADEIQRHKFPEMTTHVSYWLVDLTTAGRDRTR